jgi:DNA-binding NtrC family response regulator
MSPDPGRLLVVEDDAALLELLRVEFEDSGLEVTTARSAEAALDALGERAVDLVVSDLRLPGSSGLDLLAEVRSMEPRPAFVVITAFGTIDQAVS